jgi:hypothetical protein
MSIKLASYALESIEAVPVEMVVAGAVSRLFSPGPVVVSSWSGNQDPA